MQQAAVSEPENELHVISLTLLRAIFNKSMDTCLALWFYIPTGRCNAAVLFSNSHKFAQCGCLRLVESSLAY